MLTKETFMADAAIRVASGFYADSMTPSVSKVAEYAYIQAEHLWEEHCKRFPYHDQNPLLNTNPLNQPKR